MGPQHCQITWRTHTRVTARRRISSFFEAGPIAVLKSIFRKKMYSDPVLNRHQTQKLQQHKYNSVSLSVADAYLQPWWNFVVGLMPMWLAPNLITIIGLAINVFTSLVHLYFCPTATEETASWIPFLCAVGLFVYQTLDAIDGKQARRTGSSNALGELFDHGCDSLSTVFVCLAGACSMGMGYLPYWMMYQCLMATFLFYLAHWQTYVTGQMRFGEFDVTEGQIIIISLMMLSASFGNWIWSWKLFGFLALRWFPLCFGTIAALLSIPETVNKILFDGAGRNGSTVANTSVVAPIIPIAMTIVPAIYISVNSEQNLYEDNPILYNLTFGLIGSKITNKLIVAQMTKSELDSLDSIFLAPVCLIVNQAMGTIFPEVKILWACFIFVTFDLFWYCSNVCLEICNATGWYLFKINCTPTNSTAQPSTKNATNNSSKKHR